MHGDLRMILFTHDQLGDLSAFWQVEQLSGNKTLSCPQMTGFRFSLFLQDSAPCLASGVRAA